MYKFRTLKPLVNPHVINNVKFLSIIKKLEDVELNKIRNIGILAHIDAGKTTTTERMLYYSGVINHMGEVHHGNTVTDYMDQERERGITITSAAVTFHWRKSQFNLIDTPGHIDFTMEVEQTLNVLDGAIIVLDGSAGVEAQTLTVWRQADRYNIPRVVFVNKMDRRDASLEMSCRTISDKLEATPISLQLPYKPSGELTGIIDVLTLEKMIFTKQKNKQLEKVVLSQENDGDLFHEAKMARAKIVDKLSTYSDALADLVISSGSLDDIPVLDIVNTLREVTLKQQAVPVLIGSSYKNIGVQPLMDSVILYLPSPDDRNNHFSCFENNLCARAFKVKHDKQKGPLVFFRLYNGEMNKGQRVYSIQRDLAETTGRLYMAYADDFKEMDCIKNGNIAVVSGLKNIMSGDLVTTSQSASHKAKAKMMKLSTKISNGLDVENLEDIFGVGPRVPEPVFFCSIEPPSLAHQSALDQALIELQREDPSLRVTHDSETGQTVLSGMGELHLEIIKDRILKEYKVDAELGPLQIAYREAPITKLTDSLIVDTKIGNSKQMVNVKLSLIPKFKQMGDLIKLDKTPEAASNISGIFPKHLLAIKQGIGVGLAHGPKLGSQVVDVEIMLHFFEVGRGTSETMITATVTQLVQRLVKESGTTILEPLMDLKVVTPEEHLSAIMADLSRRRTEINNVTIRGNMKMVSGTVPLSELMGYSTVLRTISSGTATFTMEFNEYRVMSSINEDIAIKSVRGF